MLLTHEPWLTEVAGVPLLHRLMLSGSQVGIQHWLVLCCSRAQTVQHHLDTAAKLRGVTWQVYDLQTMEAAQLATILPAEDVLVSMTPAACEHRLLAAFQEAGGPALGVVPGTAEAQGQVAVQNGLVLADTSTASAVWQPTGLMRCAGAVFGQALAQVWDAIRQPSVPLAALVTGCLAQTTYVALDVTPHVWVPLVEPLRARVAEAEAQLLRRLGREGDSLFVRLVDRRVSQAITKRLMHTAVRPNQITLCSALIGLSGALMLAQPAYGWQVAGSLLFLLSTIVDGCDGEIARLTFQESDFGAKLDVCMDNVVHLFLFPCIALGLYRREYDNTYLLLGGLTLAGIILSMVVFLPYLWRRQTMRSALARVHAHLASRDFAYALPVLALVDKLHWFLWATTIGTYVFAAAWVVIAARLQADNSEPGERLPLDPMRHGKSGSGA